MIWGENSSFPISMTSKRQTCVSHSTPEAELVAMDTTLRVVAMPSRIMWDTLVPTMKAFVFGDNEAMLQVIKTGRNPTMRYLARTHIVSISWLHEVYQSGTFTFKFRETAGMAADIFTKAFSNPQKWLDAIRLVCIFCASIISSNVVWSQLSRYIQ
jgi:hypothetical protein